MTANRVQVQSKDTLADNRREIFKLCQQIKFLKDAKQELAKTQLNAAIVKHFSLIPAEPDDEKVYLFLKEALDFKEDLIKKSAIPTLHLHSPSVTPLQILALAKKNNNEDLQSWMREVMVAVFHSSDQKIEALIKLLDQTFEFSISKKMKGLQILWLGQKNQDKKRFIKPTALPAFFAGKIPEAKLWNVDQKTVNTPESHLSNIQKKFSALLRIINESRDKLIRTKDTTSLEKLNGLFTFEKGNNTLSAVTQTLLEQLIGLKLADLEANTQELSLHSHSQRQSVTYRKQA